MTGDDLRELVREVLRDALPEAIAGRSAPALDAPGAAAHVTRVSLATDDELDAFVRRIARECADPARRETLAHGAGAYALDHATGVGAASDPAAQGTVERMRVERGAVTERNVREAARRGATIVAARGVVVTPLARDRARTSGVDIEKER